MSLCFSPACSLMLVLLPAPFLTAGIHLTSQTHCSLYGRNVNWMMSWQIPCSRRTGLLSKTLSGKGFGVFFVWLRADFCIKAERGLLGVSLHEFSVQNTGLSSLCCWEHQCQPWVSGCLWHEKGCGAPHSAWGKAASHITCNISSS